MMRWVLRADRRALPTAALARTVLATACLLATGCASLGRQVSVVDGQLEHERLRYRIAFPVPGADFAWARVDVDGADVTFRSQGTGSISTLTLLSECGRTPSHLGLLARNLRIGLPYRRILYAGPLVHRGFPGWRQGFDAVLDGRPVHVSAVTVQIDWCTYDWLLVTGRRTDELELIFESWWSTFEPGPGSPAPRATLERAEAERMLGELDP